MPDEKDGWSKQEAEEEQIEGAPKPPQDDSTPDGKKEAPPRFEPELEWRETHAGRHAGDRFVRVVRPAAETFERVAPGTVRAKPAATAPRSLLGRLFSAAKAALIGPPLRSEQIIHERLTKVKGLAVLSSDNLSSVAYATEEILLVLVLAGTSALTLAWPISLAIAALIVIVAFSYRQTIKAYPQGGGSYIVAKDNLGTWPGLVAGGALLVDYVLTVAVSTTAGVAAITSAFPDLYPERVLFGVGFVGLIMLGNLRGVRESGTIFSVPTYLFIGSFLFMIALGIFKMATGNLQPADLASQQESLTQSLTLFLLLRAFASGCAALTGIEAISDGVPAFQPPEAKNAATTLSWMAAILVTIFLAISFLATRLHVVPSGQETVVSQLAAHILGGKSSAGYFIVQATTAAILVLAANTAFSDFPRLSFFLARDRFLPRQFMSRGDRLALSTGISILALAAALLIVIFQGDTHALIPLYAVGVFTAFTLSQASMVKRFWTRREPGWSHSMPISAIGATTTGLVLIVLTATKFADGAWMTILLIAALIAMFRVIEGHYHRVDKQLHQEMAELSLPKPKEPVVLVPVPEINRAVMKAVAYALSISRNVVGVHVTDDLEEAQNLRQAWQQNVKNVRLVVLESPYRLLAPALRAYLDALDKASPGQEITVVVAEVVPAVWWQRLLHRRTARRIEGMLRNRPNVVVTHIPYHLER
ncbi:MAG: APC family permease [Chloroflexi bacterium]|nr:APC family permease [Chloroflexota bacterium]